MSDIRDRFRRLVAEEEFREQVADIRCPACGRHVRPADDWTCPACGHNPGTAKLLARLREAMGK